MFFRSCLLLTLLGGSALLAPAAPATHTTNTASSVPAPKPASPPPVAAPAFVDVVKFSVQVDGVRETLVVQSAPGLLRIDEPEDRYSILYDAARDHYTGLEHGNYTYWEFTWPEVRAAVESSKRAEAHLHDLNSEGLGDYAHLSSTNFIAAAEAISNNASATVPNGSGYVWRPSTEKKRIAEVDCIRWVGETPTGDNIEAWCTERPMPLLQQAYAKLRQINEPIALVPVRTLVPPTVFAVNDALSKGGVTPLEISWGAGESRNRFAYIETARREGKMALFTIPKLYVKTTLVTMDGIGDQGLATPPTGATEPPTGLPSGSHPSR